MDSADFLGDRQLLQRLPAALLLLDESGAVLWENDRYSALFAPAADNMRALDRATRKGAGSPERCTILGHDGEPIGVLAHCLPLAGARLLLLDDTPSDADGAALRQRGEELERDSLTDRLTGAWNRRYLDKTMAGELAQSRRYRQPLSVAMLDIDHFKRVNDTFGHAAGDAVLCELVAVAHSSMRAADTLVRWGGEEFLPLNPLRSLPRERAEEAKLT